MNRRRFVAVTSVAATSVVLVACGNEQLDDDELKPTQIADVPGAPPTIAPLTSTPGAAQDGSDTGDSGDSGDAPAAETVVIEGHDDFSFSPSEVEVYPGQVLIYRNAGFAGHDLVVDEWGINTAELMNAQEEEFTIPEDAEVGTSVSFYCSVVGHRQNGMEGTFTVVEAGSESSAATTDEASAEGDATAATTDEGGEEAAAAETVVIEGNDDFSFSPSEVEVYPGQVLIYRTAGFAGHDLVVDEWGINTAELMNGQEEEFTIPEDAEVGSTVTFYCSVVGHRQNGMEGTFTVVEPGGDTAAAATTDEVPEGEATAAATEATTSATGEEATGPGEDEAVVIEGHDDFSFDPSEVEVYPGQVLTYRTAGYASHDLVVDEWGINTAELMNGQEEEFTIPEDAEVGTSVSFYCSVVGHRQNGMEGTFTVVEGGGDTAASATGSDDAAAAEGSPAAGGENDVNHVTLVGTKWQFDPAEFEIAPGGIITFQNNTGMTMGLSADEWNANQLQPMIKSVTDGNSADFKVPADAEVGAQIEIRSTLSEAVNQGMVATCTIVSADGSDTAAATTGDAEASPEASPAAAATDGESAGGGNTIEIKMLDALAFEPNEIEAAVGDVLHFLNEGYLQHDAKVDAWSDEPLTPMLLNGQTADVTIPDAAEVGQQYEFYCTVPGHLQGGMKGTITIVEGGGSTAAATTGEASPEASPAASPAASPSGEQAAGDGTTIDITMLDALAYEPNEIEASVGDTLRFTNDGFLQHDAKVDAWSDEPLTAMLLNGQSEDVVIPDVAEVGETYEFYCTVPGHAQGGMKGTITIV